MTFSDLLKDLIAEFDRLHPNGDLDVSQLDKDVLPTFVTASDGGQWHFSSKAVATLLSITHLLYDSSKGVAKRVRVDEYLTMVRQAAADCRAAGDFNLSQRSISDAKLSLRKRVDAAVASLQMEFTHYFPAWTMRIEDSQKFSIGPVSFLTRDMWLDSVRFPAKALRGFARGNAQAAAWKVRVRALLDGTGRPSKKGSLADWVYRAIKDCPSVLKISVSGSEKALSRQRAHYVCRTALDSLALLFADAEHHLQFVLADERLVPMSESRLIESKGHLWLPGAGSKPRGWMGDSAQASAAVNSPAGRKILRSSGKVIRALLDPASSKHPQLAQRWAVALAVCSEGCREVHDGLALAKLASSLDILSAGGMEAGILRMLLHITGQKETDVVVKQPQPMTFKKVVERIYSHGRSQFLHGNHVDPFIRFDEERRHATTLARAALRTAVVRLAAYQGADSAKAFSTM